MFHSTTSLCQIPTFLNYRKHSLTKHCFLPFKPPVTFLFSGLIQFPSAECDLCRPARSLSSWPFCGWSVRSPGGTTAATGRRPRSTWCCASAASKSTSSWTSSTSSSLTRDCRSLQMVLSRPRRRWGVLCLRVFVGSNPSQEPEHLRLRKGIISPVAWI